MEIMPNDYHVYRPKGYQRITDMSSVTSLTIPAGAEYAYVEAEGADVRFTTDGETTPTTSVGHLLDVSTQFDNQFRAAGRDVLEALQFLETGTGAILNVSYYAKAGN